MNSIRNLIRPEDFQTHAHYWNTFGNCETEISARWIIRFLQHRNAEKRGGDSFNTGSVVLDMLMYAGFFFATALTCGLFVLFVKSRRLRRLPDNGWGSFTYEDINAFYNKERNAKDNITFNRLLTLNETKEKYPLTCRKVNFTKDEENNHYWHRAWGRDIIEITDVFICCLASNPEMFAASPAPKQETEVKKAA